MKIVRETVRSGVEAFMEQIGVQDKLDKMENTKARAPLASQEAMEESPIQMCGEVSESVRGKEFKVIHVLANSCCMYV